MVKSADRAMRLIEALATSSPRRFTDLAAELGIPKGSLHALLEALSASGWVVVERHRGVRLGYRALAMSPAAPDLTDLARLASAPLTRLRDGLGETVHIATLEGRAIEYLSSRYSDHALGVRFPPGRRLPAQLTALGKAMLAELGDDDLAAALPVEYPTPTPTSIPDERALRSVLQQVGLQGYAEDDGENILGVHCVAVAVHHRELPACALSCSIPVARFDPSRVPQIVERLSLARAEILDRLPPAA